MVERRNENSGAPLAPVILFGLLVVLLGAFLSMMALTLRMPLQVSEMPEEGEMAPGTVYYLPGKVGMGDAWLAKRDSFVEEGAAVIEVTEGELNSWALARFDAPPVLEETESARVLGMEADPNRLNFRIADGKLQVLFEIYTPIRKQTPFVYQARGHFERIGAGGPQFVVEEGHIGSSPIPRIPFLGQVFHEHLTKGLFSNFEEYVALQEVWSAISSIEIRENSLYILRR